MRNLRISGERPGLTADGAVFAWGLGELGALGLSKPAMAAAAAAAPEGMNRSAVFMPTRVDLPPPAVAAAKRGELRVATCSCSEHTVFYVCAKRADEMEAAAATEAASGAAGGGAGPQGCQLWRRRVVPARLRSAWREACGACACRCR